MRARRLLALLPLLAASCERPASPTEKAASDARDVALVEAAQTAPSLIVPLKPEPILHSDVEAKRLSGASCSFTPDGRRSLVALAMADTAFLKLDGALRVYAADSGSGRLPHGVGTRFLGREHVLDLQIAGGEGRPSGDETPDWRGRLTVRDPNDRVVYSATGRVRCGDPVQLRR